jgi:ribosomal protein S18 acetylase RimI-like enzyme
MATHADLLGLDNAFWTSLATRHAHLSLGGALARRYPTDISPITGLPGTGPANIAALASIVDVGDDAAFAGPFVPSLPGNWETLYESDLIQMLRPERTSLPEGDFDVATLTSTDVPEMLDLVERTRPGPFRKRTIELGTYIGIRDQGRLVAMAGERTWIGDCREVSAVCTSPEVQGRGMAQALIGRVVNRMLRASETPFLHVDSKVDRAIALYRRLGFVVRSTNPLLYAKRIA